MNMYATLSFTSVVAYAALVLISLLFIALIVDAVRPKNNLERALEKYDAARGGYSVRTDWRKVGVLFAIWFVSGWYLFG